MGKKDLNELAKFITDIATGETTDTRGNKKGNVTGRSGGLVGGKARADSLTAERRKEIAHAAAAKRWGK